MNGQLKTLRLVLTLLITALLAGLAGSSAFAQGKPAGPPSTQQSAPTINGSPLTVRVLDSLAMEVYFNGATQFFSNNAGGTFVEVDGVVYGSNPPASGSFDPLPFTAVSNSGPTGSGSAGDPFTITTVADAGTSGVRVTQTTTYVNGETFYTVSVQVANSSSSERSVRIFHGADLYLNFPGNVRDSGFGFYDPGSGAVGALSQDQLNTQVFIPVTPADAYQEAFYSTFWRQIGGSGGASGPGFNNTINPSFHDTAAGLQYNRSVPAGGSTTVTLRGAFGLIADIPAIQVPEEERITEDPAFMTVVVRPTPNIRAARGSIINYVIVITNRGEGRARETTIRMPFNPRLVTVLDATFAGSSTAWVSELGNDGLTIRTGPISGDGTVVTATLRVRVNDDAAPGADLSGRLSFEWDDSVDGGVGASNTTILTVGESSLNVVTYSFGVEPASAPIGVVRTFSSAIFVPGEPVALWISTPDGRNVPIEEDGDDDQFEADDDGEISIDLTLSDFAAGAYSIVAYGLWTEFTATGITIIQ